MKTTYWKILLELTKRIRNFPDELKFLVVQKEQIYINSIPANLNDDSIFIKLESSIALPTNYTTFDLKNTTALNVEDVGKISSEDLQFLKIYLPYCFLAYFSKKLQRCISITHFAQSLDGKIATESGDSRWIGNEENLDHAHRMRALCDGILVGNNTVRNDQPSLTVRRVTGENPKRIILGSSEVDLSSLIECCPNPILVVSNKAKYDLSQVEHLRVPSENCRIDSQDLLKLLFEKEIYSVYIEGGAKTTSNF